VIVFSVVCYVLLLVVQKSLWKLSMNSHLSLNVLTNVLSLLNLIYQSDNVTKCPVQEFSSTWHRLQTLTSQYTDNSLISSLAVLTLAIVIRHGPQSAISQSVDFSLNCYFLQFDFLTYDMKQG